MPNRHPQQGRQVVLAVLFLVAFLGIIVMVGARAIGELPTADRPGAWRLFWVGWLLVTIAGGSMFIPYWRAGTLIPESAREQAANLARVKRMGALGGPLGLLGGALSFLGAGFWVALAAVVGGLGTAMLLLTIALHTTKKGRAMLRRRRI